MVSNLIFTGAGRDANARDGIAFLSDQSGIKQEGIVIDGVEAFEEDYAASLSIERAAPLETIGLAPVKPCPRCPIPAVDQSTGEVGPNPVDVLQSYRTNPLVDGGISFGMNTIVIHGAGQYLALGDTVQLHLAF